jgi:hypothetical protein
VFLLLLSFLYSKHFWVRRRRREGEKSWNQISNLLRVAFALRAKGKRRKEKEKERVATK